MKSYFTNSPFSKTLRVLLLAVSLFVLAACDFGTETTKSVASIKVNEQGNLITTYSDGSTVDFGNIGNVEDGLDGISIGEDGKFKVTLSNGETKELGTVIGQQGEDVSFSVTSTHIVWKYANETEYTEMFPLNLLKGENGKEVELQVSATHIQWRYVGETTWKDLIALSILTGPKGTDGKQVEFNLSTTHIQWRYVGATQWTNLVELSLITGQNGTDGKQVEFGLSATHIQWRYIGDTEWKDVVELSLITGDDGQNAKAIVLRTSETHIQWSYEGTEEWFNLVELSLLSGVQGHTGENGKSAYQIYLEKYPDYTGSETQWIDDLVNGRLATKPKYAVTFDSDGATDLDVQYVFEFEKATAPQTPKKAGYLFEGWYLGEDKWLFNIFLVSEPITLTARWIENPLNFEVDDKTVIYNTEVQKYEISNLPEGITASYENNEHKNAGVYEVLVTLTDTTGTYLVPEPFTVVFTIEKATLSNISFESKDIRFNGTLQTLTITGTLPIDVIVQYTPNTRTYAGRLEVIAVFLYDYNNYNVLSNLKAELAIYYDVTFVEFNKSTTVKYYTDITSAPVATRPGYTFSGWSTVQNNRNNIVKYPHKLQGHTTLYAIYA